jgi:hypothetical protein
MSVETNSKPGDRVAPAEPGLRLAARSSLDVMLSDAVLEGGGVGRFVKPQAAGRTIAGLARHPRRAASDAGRFGVELARVAAGHSEARPSKGDRRFGERAWRDNWLLRRVMQGYLATCETADRLISDAGLDWRTERQARFAASNVLDALAPTNFPWSNPAVLKESIDAGGANLVRGGRRFVRDMTRPPHLPASVDVTKFEVGGNLAVTPGSVVLPRGRRRRRRVTRGEQRALPSSGTLRVFSGCAATDPCAMLLNGSRSCRSRRSMHDVPVHALARHAAIMKQPATAVNGSRVPQRCRSDVITRRSLLPLGKQRSRPPCAYDRFGLRGATVRAPSRCPLLARSSSAGSPGARRSSGLKLKAAACCQLYKPRIAIAFRRRSGSPRAPRASACS